jgi:hypothetical protein
MTRRTFAVDRGGRRCISFARPSPLETFGRHRPGPDQPGRWASRTPAGSYRPPPLGRRREAPWAARSGKGARSPTPRVGQDLRRPAALVSDSPAVRAGGCKLYGLWPPFPSGSRQYHSSFIFMTARALAFAEHPWRRPWPARPRLWIVCRRCRRATARSLGVWNARPGLSGAHSRSGRARGRRSWSLFVLPPGDRPSAE